MPTLQFKGKSFVQNNWLSLHFHSVTPQLGLGSLGETVIILVSA